MLNPSKSPFMLIFVLSIFGMVLVGVTFLAYSRPSGHTGLDMAKVQELRKQSSKQLTNEIVDKGP